jgi:hypothetical protein
MKPSKQHAMNLVRILPTGEEEWLCPTCGCRLKIQWSPRFKRTSLDAGDPYALHSASKGEGFGFGAASMEITQPAADDAGPADDDLQIWRDGLSGLDLDGF